MAKKAFQTLRILASLWIVGCGSVQEPDVLSRSGLFGSKKVSSITVDPFSISGQNQVDNAYLVFELGYRCQREASHIFSPPTPYYRSDIVYLVERALDSTSIEYELSHSRFLSNEQVWDSMYLNPDGSFGKYINAKGKDLGCIVMLDVLVYDTRYVAIDLVYRRSADKLPLEASLEQRRILDELFTGSKPIFKKSFSWSFIDSVKEPGREFTINERAVHATINHFNLLKISYKRGKEIAGGVYEYQAEVTFSLHADGRNPEVGRGWARGTADHPFF